MANDLIRYDVLVQHALRGVVRRILTDSARDGLPGSHHFYISFDTNAPGVKLTPRLHAMYPEEMTVVLQHQFWDLAVNDTGFEVSLSFDKIPERLVVPYESITGFFDPSVKFGLKFEAVHGEDKAEPAAPAGAKPRKSSARAKAAEESEAAPLPMPRKSKGAGKTGPAEEPAPAAAAAADEAGPAAPAGKAEVVSLDAFRKKK